MPTYLDLASWPRREHFRFFRGYHQPYFNLCAEVDVSALYARCKAPGGPSFFAASLYLSLRAANAVEPFRYRLRGERVVVYELIHGGSTVLRDDDTFAFAYFPFEDRFAPFARTVAAEVTRVRGGPPRVEPAAERDDLIHYSVIPWLAFTSFAHARDRRDDDPGVPKIVFGKHHRAAAGRRRMPVSVEVHHALMDGLQVGRFFAEYQRRLDDLAELD